jgi:hypothetical protein
MLGFLVSWLIGVRTYLLIPRWETNQLGFHKWCLTPIYYLPIHNGSHEPWNKHAENILNSKLDKLINIYCNKWGQTRFSLPLLSHFNGVLPSWHYLKRFLP